MTRPLTRYAQQQNALFLRHLRLTGNVREAARRAGVNRATLFKRRASHPVFRTEWDAALALADAALHRSTTPPGAAPRVVTLKGGRRQLRRARANRIDHDVRQRFLSALSASANIRLAATAAGFSHSAFYRLRERDPAFAREMRAALELGYARVEAALLASWSDHSVAHEDWAVNEPPALAPMTAAEALQLLHLHQREVRLRAEPPHLKKRRGESDDVHRYRLAVMHAASLAEERASFRRAEAERALGAREYVTPSAPLIPDLAQVTGWSRRDPAKAGHAPAVPFDAARSRHLEGRRGGGDEPRER